LFVLCLAWLSTRHDERANNTFGGFGDVWAVVGLCSVWVRVVVDAAASAAA
jgi:hypothetical protein